ncbi:DUF3299 domain-containing protein [Piscinibacter sakaiensis]|uniref:DUF3299 domain-containing protein n=1 Tax=Piscinibacter sakaiensis TaxID=1547922 RepID=UPI003AAC38D8
MNLRLSLPGLRRALAIACLILGPALASAQATKPSTTYETIKWEALMPKDWDPMKGLNLPTSGLLIDDGDPRSQELMRKMRESWDNAPTNAKMDGAAVKLAGYVVPLEESKAGLKEFLLVPYFGACIHSPPPPANQIIHVLANPPLKGVNSMDAVWASGVVNTQRQNSEMGVSGYQMKAARVEPYVPPTRR